MANPLKTITTWGSGSTSGAGGPVGGAYIYPSTPLPQPKPYLPGQVMPVNSCLGYPVCNCSSCSSLKSLMSHTIQNQNQRKITITIEDMNEAIQMWLQAKMIKEPIQVTKFYANDWPGVGSDSLGTFDIHFTLTREELAKIGE